MFSPREHVARKRLFLPKPPSTIKEFLDTTPRDDDARKAFVTTCIFLRHTRGGHRIRILRRQAAVRRSGIVVFVVVVVVGGGGGGGGGGTLLGLLVPTRREGGGWRRRRQDEEEIRPVGPNGEGFRVAAAQAGGRPRLLQIASAGGC